MNRTAGRALIRFLGEGRIHAGLDATRQRLTESGFQTRVVAGLSQEQVELIVSVTTSDPDPLLVLRRRFIARWETAVLDARRQAEPDT